MVDEALRHEIHGWLLEAMGDRKGNGLMEMRPPVGWADVATKHDLAQLEERLELRFDRVQESIDHRFKMVDLRFESLEYKLLGAIDEKLTAQTRALFLGMVGLMISFVALVIHFVH